MAKKQKLHAPQQNQCWRYALCDLLGYEPKRVPDFVGKYKDVFVEETRKWLNRRGKSIVFVPFREFLDSSKIRYNRNMFPDGRCIACLTPNNHTGKHASLLVDGKFIEYDGSNNYLDVVGYFIVYDLKQYAKKEI